MDKQRVNSHHLATLKAGQEVQMYLEMRVTSCVEVNRMWNVAWWDEKKPHAQVETAHTMVRLCEPNALVEWSLEFTAQRSGKLYLIWEVDHTVSVQIITQFVKVK